MSRNQEKVSERLKNVEFDVMYWRERFQGMKSGLPKNWMGELVSFNAEYDSYEGTLTMMAVQKNRAGLVKTMDLVKNLEAMLKCPKKGKSVYQRWKKGGLVSK